MKTRSAKREKRLEFPRAIHLPLCKRRKCSSRGQKRIGRNGLMSGTVTCSSWKRRKRGRIEDGVTVREIEGMTKSFRVTLAM
jgi:hypothetical protein